MLPEVIAVYAWRPLASRWRTRRGWELCAFLPVDFSDRIPRAVARYRSR